MIPVTPIVGSLLRNHAVAVERYFSPWLMDLASIDTDIDKGGRSAILGEHRNGMGIESIRLNCL